MLLGFKKRFVEPILIGTKVHTMRNKPKRKPKIGETLHMYTGLRTKYCSFISDYENLISVQKVRVIMNRKGTILRGRFPSVTYDLRLWVDGKELLAAQLETFVRFDGFESVSDFCEFWFEPHKKSVNKLGGRMLLYHWTDLKY